MKKPKLPETPRNLPDRKFMVTTGSFIAGCVVDPNIDTVHTTDHFLRPLLGLSEQQMRDYCAKNRWALAEVSQ